MIDWVIKVINVDKNKIDVAYGLIDKLKTPKEAIQYELLFGMPPGLSVFLFRVNWGYRFTETFPCW